MKLDPAKGPDTKNWAQCKIQSLIWLLERITRDTRTMSGGCLRYNTINICYFSTFFHENFSDVHKCAHSKIIRGNSQGDWPPLLKFWILMNNQGKFKFDRPALLWRKSDSRFTGNFLVSGPCFNQLIVVTTNLRFSFVKVFKLATFYPLPVM